MSYEVYKETLERVQNAIDGYDIDGYGIVKSPGKFEAEHITTLYFWSLVSDGVSDDTVYDGDGEFGTTYEVFFTAAMEQDERLALMESGIEFEKDCHAIVIWETEQGFVERDDMTEEEYHAFCKEIENRTSEEESE